MHEFLTHAFSFSNHAVTIWHPYGNIPITYKTVTT